MHTGPRQAVPVADIATNNYTDQVVGSKDDAANEAAGASLVGLGRAIIARLVAILAWLQGGSVPDSPSLVAPTLAAGTTLTAGAAWVLGALGEILTAVAAPVGNYVVDAVMLDTPSAGFVGELVLYYGAADTECGRCKVEVATDAGVVPPIPIFSGTIPGGSRVRAAFATVAGATTVGCSIQYHAL